MAKQLFTITTNADEVASQLTRNARHLRKALALQEQLGRIPAGEQGAEGCRQVSYWDKLTGLLAAVELNVGLAAGGWAFGYAADMLWNALLLGEDVSFGPNSEIARDIASSAEVERLIDDIVRKTKSTGPLSGTAQLKFRSGNLFLSIHGAQAKYGGYVFVSKVRDRRGVETGRNVKGILQLRVTDRYDFEHSQKYYAYGPATALGDLAAQAQKAGGLHPFQIDIFVRKEFTRHVPNDKEEQK